jgi:hypothetical protein
LYEWLKDRPTSKVDSDVGNGGRDGITASWVESTLVGTVVLPAYGSSGIRMISFEIDKRECQLTPLLLCKDGRNCEKELSQFGADHDTETDQDLMPL